MNTLEKKIDAVMQLLTADTDAERQKAMEVVRSMMDKAAAAVKPLDAEDTVREILLEIGAPDHLIGHQYLIRAILMVVEDQAYIKNIIHGIYPQLANEFNTTASRVERAIRNLIDVTWDRGDPDVLYKYFGNSVSAYKGKPTNGEFIARIANVVKQRMKEAA